MSLFIVYARNICDQYTQTLNKQCANENPANIKHDSFEQIALL